MSLPGALTVISRFLLLLLASSTLGSVGFADSPARCVRDGLERGFKSMKSMSEGDARALEEMLETYDRPLSSYFSNPPRLAKGELPELERDFRRVVDSAISGLERRMEELAPEEEQNLVLLRLFRAHSARDKWFERKLQKNHLGRLSKDNPTPMGELVEEMFSNYVAIEKPKLAPLSPIRRTLFQTRNWLRGRKLWAIDRAEKWAFGTGLGALVTGGIWYFNVHNSEEAVASRAWEEARARTIGVHLELRDLNRTTWNGPTESWDQVLRRYGAIAAKLEPLFGPEGINRLSPQMRKYTSSFAERISLRLDTERVNAARALLEYRQAEQDKKRKGLESKSQALRAARTTLAEAVANEMLFKMFIFNIPQPIPPDRLKKDLELIGDEAILAEKIIEAADLVERDLGSRIALLEDVR